MKSRSTNFYILLILVASLVVVGVLAVYSSGSYNALLASNNPQSYLIRQLAFVVGSLIIIGVALWKGKRSYLENEEVIYWALLIAILALLLVTLIGEETKGSRAWFRFGGFSVQPSEFLKPIFIWYVAHYLTKMQSTPRISEDKSLSSFENFWRRYKRECTFGFSLIFIAICLFAQPDLGGLIIFAVVTMALLLAGSPWDMRTKVAYVAGAFAVYLFAVYILAPNLLKGYQLNRILVYFNPFDPNTAADLSLQVRNSFYALARGGLTGVGIGQSIQKTGYLPEAHNDFVLSIIGEELGFIGVLVIVGMLFALIYLTFWFAGRVRRQVDSYFLIGVGVWFFIQTVLNISGVINLAPLTGVTLPLISYGGSSILVSLLTLSLVLKIIYDDNRRELLIAD